MKNAINVLLILTSFSQLILFSDSKFRYALRKFTCETSGKTVMKNISCSYRTIKRNNFLTIKGVIVRKLPNAFLNASNWRLTSDAYQTVVDVKAIPICHILRNFESASMIPFVKDTIEFYKKSFGNGNFMDGCNLIGELNLFNASFVNYTLEYYPAGM